MNGSCIRGKSELRRGGWRSDLTEGPPASYKRCNDSAIREKSLIATPWASQLWLRGLAPLTLIDTG